MRTPKVTGDQAAIVPANLSPVSVLIGSSPVRELCKLTQSLKCMLIPGHTHAKRMGSFDIPSITEILVVIVSVVEILFRLAKAIPYTARSKNGVSFPPQ